MNSNTNLNSKVSNDELEDQKLLSPKIISEFKSILTIEKIKALNSKCKESKFF